MNQPTQTETSNNDKPSARRSFVDADTILRIKNLELRAKVIVEGFMSGLHRSPYHGFSVEFTDYREYSPGDDLRHLDWKLLARRDRKYIKRFEDETNLRCHLLVDLSRSMEFGTTAMSKSEYAKTVAASLAHFLALQCDATGVITFDDSIKDILPPKFRPGHLRRLMMCLEKSTGGTSTDLSRPLEQIASTVTKRGLIVLISDLLSPTEDLTRQLGYLRSMGHDIVLLRILDPTEINFSFESASMFQDLETGTEIYVDPQTIAADYRSQFSKHESVIKKFCNEQSIDFFQMTTDDPIENSLFNLVQARGHKKTRSQRARQTSGSRSGGSS